MVMDTMNPYVIEYLCMIRDDDKSTILILKIIVMLMAMATVFGVLIVLAMDMTMLLVMLMMSKAIACVFWLVICLSYLPMFCICTFSA